MQSAYVHVDLLTSFRNVLTGAKLKSVLDSLCRTNKQYNYTKEGNVNFAIFFQQTEFELLSLNNNFEALFSKSVCRN